MKKFYVWALFSLLALLTIAAGTTEPDTPAWRTGPVNFEEATRVHAFYCENQGATRNPGTPTAYGQILAQLDWTSLSQLRANFENAHVVP